MKLVLCSVLLSVSLFAQTAVEQPYRFNRDTVTMPPAKRFDAAEGAYWGSVAFMVAGHFADHNSSVGRVELNPVLRGGDGRYDSGRGIAIKAAYVGALVVTQRLLLRKHPKLKQYSTVVNLAVGSVSFGIAARNRKLK